MSSLYPSSAGQIRSSELRLAAVRKEEEALLELELRIRNLRAETDREKQVLQEGRESLRKEKASLQTARSEANSELEAVKRSLETLEESRRKLESELKKQQANFAKRGAQLQEKFEREQASLTKEKVQINKGLEEMQVEYRDKRAAIDRSFEGLRTRELELDSALERLAAQEAAYKTEKEAVDNQRVELEMIKSEIATVSTRRQELGDEQSLLLKESEALDELGSSLAARKDALAKQESQIKDDEARYRKVFSAFLDKERDLTRRSWALSLNRGAAVGVIMIAIAIVSAVGSQVVRKVFLELL